MHKAGLRLLLEVTMARNMWQSKTVHLKARQVKEEGEGPVTLQGNIQRPPLGPPPKGFLIVPI